MKNFERGIKLELLVPILGVNLEMGFNRAISAAIFSVEKSGEDEWGFVGLYSW